MSRELHAEWVEGVNFKRMRAQYLEENLFLRREQRDTGPTWFYFITDSSWKKLPLAFHSYSHDAELSTSLEEKYKLYMVQLLEHLANEDTQCTASTLGTPY